MFHMGTNGRVVGPLVEAVATEIRVELARKKIGVRELSRLSGVPYSTARKCVEGLRAIDIEELSLLSAALGLTPSAIVERAEAAVAAEAELSEATPSLRAVAKSASIEPPVE